MKNPFKKSSAIQTGIAVLGAGAGSAVADWLLEKYNIIDESWEKTTVNIAKIAGGAILGAMVPNKGTWWGLAKSACDGIATVAAANLVSDLLPENETAGGQEGTNGLPKGMIGRAGMRLGQRGYVRRAKVAGVAATPAAMMTK